MRLRVRSVCGEVPVCDGARFKYKLLGVMVYFLPAKNKHQSVL
jgi:hypothetical protein